MKSPKTLAQYFLVLCLLVQANMATAQCSYFQQTYGGTDLTDGETIPTIDGGFLLPHSGVDGAFFKVDCNGQFEWNIDLTTSAVADVTGQLGRQVEALPDGNYAIAGLAPTSNLSQNLFLVKISPAGSILWEHYFPISSNSNGNVVLAAIPSGGFFIGDGYGILIKTDADGNLIWQKTGATYTPISMVASSDGGAVYVVNPTTAGYNDVVVRKVDGNGDVVWTQSYGPLAEYGDAITDAGNGNFAVVGTQTTANGDRNVFFIRIGPNGNLLSAFSHGNANNESVTSVTRMANGRFLITGGIQTSDWHQYACQLYPNGSLIAWAESYSRGFFYDAKETANGELAFFGSHWDTNDFELVKTSSDGSLTNSPNTVNVSGPVFQDLNGNCEYEPGEPLLSNVLVGIRAESGFTNLTQYTDSNGNYNFDVPPGEYYGVAIIAPNNNPYCVPCCIDFCNYNFLDGSIPISYNLGMTCTVPGPQPLTGFVFYDENENCQLDLGESGIQTSWTLQVVKAGTQDSFFIDPGPINSGGNFSLQVDTGTYYLTIMPPNSLYLSCIPVQTVTVGLGGAPTVYFPIMTLADCPSLSVDITTIRLRPCMTNNYVVQYCNQGTTTAEDAYVRLTLPSALSVEQSALPGTPLPGNVWEFQLGDVPAGYCGNFWVKTLLDCNEPVGLTYCVEAHIFPDSICGPQNAQWDGSSVELSANCVGDSVVLSISNAGWGDMAQPLNFIVVEDNVLIKDSTFQLPAGGMTNVTVYPNGATIILSAQQAVGHPSLSLPLVFVEGCGGDSISLGFVSQYPMPDNDDFTAIDCRESVNSFDPNIKEAQPKGITDAHFIESTTDLSYQITFQNLGTAPAEAVVILDTLSQFLDTARLELGAASHPYTFELLPQNVLKFTFPDIQLPQASQDPEGSIGFVKFRLRQRPGNQPGTVITNRAAIYFDNNPAVITPEVFHTIPYPIMTQETHLSICSGESWNGLPITADTAILNTVKYAFFDSVFVTNISVLPTASANVSATICNGEAYSLGIEVYSQSGIYTQLLTAQNGCDSTATLNLTVLPVLETETTATICAGETYTFGNGNYSQSGTYSQVFAAQNGCDSTVTLNLTVLPPALLSINGTLCFGESIVVNGTTYDANNLFGTEVLTGAGTNGCDSTIQVFLAFFPEAINDISATICEGETYELNGETYTTEGTYTQMLLSGNNCDSTVQLFLDVLPLLVEQVDTMVLPGTGVFGVVVNADTVFVQTYMDENACLERTVNVHILTATGPEKGRLQDLVLSPNPTSGSFTLSGNLATSAICEARLLDAYGRTVLRCFEGEWLAGAFNKKIDLQDVADGIYFLHFATDGERRVVKLVVGGR